MKAWNYLSEWTSYALPKNIQKRLYKFVLRRAIGQFLQNELDLENFDIALMNGNLELRDLDLNLQVIDMRGIVLWSRYAERASTSSSINCWMIHHLCWKKEVYQVLVLPYLGQNS